MQEPDRVWGNWEARIGKSFRTKAEEKQFYSVTLSNGADPTFK